MHPKVGSKQPVSLLILDVNMPIMHGLETSQKVKELYDAHNKCTETILTRPLIVLWSQNDMRTIQQFITEDEQADMYWQKPLTKNELLSLIEKMNLN